MLEFTIAIPPEIEWGAGVEPLAGGEALTPPVQELFVNAIDTAISCNIANQNLLLLDSQT